MLLFLVKMVGVAAGVEMRKYYLGFTSAQYFLSTNKCVFLNKK
jgi:hypothetical protein